MMIEKKVLNVFKCPRLLNLLLSITHWKSQIVAIACCVSILCVSRSVCVCLLLHDSCVGYCIVSQPLSPSSVSTSLRWQVTFSGRRRPMRVTVLFSALVYVFLCVGVCVCLCVTNVVYSQPVGSLRVLHVACRGNGQRKWRAIRAREGEKEKTGRTERQRERQGHLS